MKALKKLRKKEHGSFTLEATILFPILLIIVLLFVFFSLVIYEKVTLQYKANRMASEMAHAWDSSTMDIQTNEMTKEDYVTSNGDGLYWRLSSNNLLKDKLNLVGISLDSSDLVQKKINRAGEFSGDITFKGGFFVQKVNVNLNKELGLPSSISNVFGINQIGATSEKPVLDPVETIRNTDFMIYGFDKFAQIGKDLISKFLKKK